MGDHLVPIKMISYPRRCAVETVGEGLSVNLRFLRLHVQFNSSTGEAISSKSQL